MLIKINQTKKSFNCFETVYKSLTLESFSLFTLPKANRYQDFLKVSCSSPIYNIMPQLRLSLLTTSSFSQVGFFGPLIEMPFCKPISFTGLSTKPNRRRLGIPPYYSSVLIFPLAIPLPVTIVYDRFLFYVCWAWQLAR